MSENSMEKQVTLWDELSSQLQSIIDSTMTSYMISNLHNLNCSNYSSDDTKNTQKNQNSFDIEGREKKKEITPKCVEMDDSGNNRSSNDCDSENDDTE